MPRLKQFTVVSTFDSGHFEYDSALALIHVGDAARLFRVDGPTGLRFELVDLLRAPEVASELAQSLAPAYWCELVASEPQHFSAVQMRNG